MYIHSAKLLADKFIEAHVHEFGLLGSNVKRNPSAGFPITVRQAGSDFSEGQSFKFGYNGELFGFRDSSTCMFWTEHAAPVRPVASPLEEMLRASKVVSTILGTPQLVFSASVSCLGILEAFHLAEQPLTVLVPQFDANIRHEALLAQQRYGSFQFKNLDLSRSEIASRVLDVASTFRGVDFWQTLGIAIQEKRGGAFLFESYLPRLRDQNFDLHTKAQVGPQNLCMEEFESDYESWRGLRILGASGIPNFFMVTPELLPALLELFLQAGPILDGRLVVEPAFEKLMGIKSVGILPETMDWIAEIESELKKRHPKSAEVWLTPIARIPLGPAARITGQSMKDVYGVVF